VTSSVAELELRAGALRLALRADLGGAVAGLWCDALPVLRSVEPQALARVDDAACFVLLPYSNRLGHRRFEWLGRHHATAANFPGMPHSLHGLGWQRAWTVLAADATQARLALTHAPDADWPFAFHAEQRIALTPGGLRLELSLRNDAAEPAPAGLGWHPYFPKRPRTRLRADVRERWEADAAMLPTQRVAQPGIDADVADLAFDHGFDGWRGAARIDDAQLSLQLTSSLDRLVVYTPPHDPFFAVEPVSHATDAIHMAAPAQHGLRSLAPGETFSAWLQLGVRPA
jgi:aldose 1-epimerase